MELTLYGRPNPRQAEFFASTAAHTAYGGARGGGKSWAMRRKLVLLCLGYKGLNCLLLRRTLPELRENHVIPLLKELGDAAAYNATERVFRFPNGSRLKLAENIAVTKQVADFAHANDIACEAELGSVMGHEGAGANMDYEEIFRTKKGFTDLGEAKQFAEETKCDWLSVAVGSIHGAIAEGVRNQKKPEARLDIEHIADLSKVTGIPLVLHGGSGINNQCILDGIANGIAKINVGTEIRQTYERTLGETNDVEKARAAVYPRTCEIIRSFRIEGNQEKLFG